MNCLWLILILAFCGGNTFGCNDGCERNSDWGNNRNRDDSCGCRSSRDDDGCGNRRSRDRDDDDCGCRRSRDDDDCGNRRSRDRDDDDCGNRRDRDRDDDCGCGEGSRRRTTMPSFSRGDSDTCGCECQDD